MDADRLLPPRPGGFSSGLVGLVNPPWESQVNHYRFARRALAPSLRVTELSLYRNDRDNRGL